MSLFGDGLTAGLVIRLVRLPFYFILEGYFHVFVC